jgi:hypothetical protein
MLWFKRIDSDYQLSFYRRVKLLYGFQIMFFVDICGFVGL